MTPGPPRRVYRTAVVGPVESLDPAAARSGAEILLASNLTESLFVRDPGSGLPAPSAAESVTAGAQGKSLTFTLRKDLRWSDGGQVTAEDFAFSWKRLLNSDSWAVDLFAQIRGAEEYGEGAMMDPVQLGIRVLHEGALGVELTRPGPALLDALSLPVAAPVPRAALDRFKSEWTLPANWVGNGPFVVAKQTPSLLVLAKNPHHRWASRIALDEVEISVVASREEGARLFLEKRVDQFGDRESGVPPSFLAKFAGRPELLHQPDLRTYFLRLQGRKSPVSSLSVRQALAMSIDRPLLAEGFASEKLPPALSMVPGGIKGYEAPRGYLYNVPGALRLLHDLGYCTRLKSAKCKPVPSLPLLHRDTPRMRKAALALREIWKKTLGLEAVRTEVKADEEFDRAVRTGQYVLALDEIRALPERPFEFLEAFHSKGEGGAGFASKPYDELLAAAGAELSWEKARGIYRRAEALLLREAVVIPLLHGTTPILVSRRVSGFTPNIWDWHPFAEISVSP